MLEALTNYTNRSLNQTKQLLLLCGWNLNTLVDLEEKLHNGFYTHSLSTKEQVSEVLATTPTSNWMDLSEYKENYLEL